MFRYILVPAAGSQTHDAVFRTALTLARQSGGHLGFMHVQPDVLQLVSSVPATDFGGGAGIGTMIDQLQQDVDSCRDRAKEAVLAFCAREHVALTETPCSGAPSATFRVETGEETRLLPKYARAADLTVLGRARDGEAVAMDVLESVLLDSGRPLVIAPAQPVEQIGTHIAIAWKDTPEAARAVASAMPLLRKAASVTIVMVQEHPDDDSDAGRALRSTLLWHNPATTVRAIPAADHEPAELLLEVVQESHADLLVMGGYSHSRMREAIFGGFTRRMLRSAPLPVLITH